MCQQPSEAEHGYEADQPVHSCPDESVAPPLLPSGPDAAPAPSESIPPSQRPLSWMARMLLAMIGGYRLFLGPFLGGRCRFIPSCSEYGLLAIRKYGAWKGGWKTMGRILRCQPFCQGGVDFP